MAVMIIGYDLNKAKNYPDLIEAIKNVGSKWWHYLDSTWLVVTNLTASQVRDTLKGHIDSDDELLVMTYGKGAAWAGFDAKASDWLRDNL